MDAGAAFLVNFMEGDMRSAGGGIQTDWDRDQTKRDIALP
jgi:hypothetical protein